MSLIILFTVYQQTNSTLTPQIPTYHYTHTQHLGGSHQNVFIDKLIETLDIGNLSPYLLLSTDFPTGIKYHHDRPYMKGIELGIYKPYNFHMCWTLNKANKIDYFIKSNMWYINGNSINKDGDGGGNHDIGDKCALSSSYSKPSGTIYKEFISSSSSSIQDMMKKTNAFENKCCISNERKM